MYFVEHDAQPDKFSSIPETMWWSVTTLTTVGYGDVFPITSLGRILTACISILGIGMFALPAGILASGFSTEFQKIKKEKNVCPHCGIELTDNK
jgi:voltage-gated potassium channel